MIKMICLTIDRHTHVYICVHALVKFENIKRPKIERKIEADERLGTIFVSLRMPVSTAISEWSFSTVKQIKTPCETRGFLKHIYMYSKQEINAEQTIDDFALKRERHLALLFHV